MARLQVGSESFREIRENDFCYVDKTGFIEEFLTSSFIKFSLITRPRRFGKTLMMSMLRDFFDITQDSKAIFDGLAISKNKALCDKWMNQYPTVFVTFKRTGGLSFKDALGKIRSRMSDVCHSFAFLIDSPAVDENDREDLKTLKSKKGDQVLLSDSLKIHCRALQAHYGKPAILLIDEYDVPLSRAQENGYYREMVAFIRDMLEEGLKSNDFLQFGILTGCLRISKESIFTGLNNFSCFDISDFDFDDKFGFTPREVDDLLAVAGCPEKKDAIKEWYDGYRFGSGTKIYCPWDILYYLCRLKSNPNAMPDTYWTDTSGNAAVRDFIGRADCNAVEKIEKLLSGGYVAVSISQTLPHDTLYASEANLWTLLYQSGCLTQADPRKVKRSDAGPDTEKTPLVIPNKEIRLLFIETIRELTSASIKAMNKKPFLDAFWNGDGNAVQDILSGILLNTIYYDKYYENFYHAMLERLIIEAGYAPEFKNKSSQGRADIIVTGPTLAHAAVVEVRLVKSREKMPEAADDALIRISKQRYVRSLEGRYKKVMLWGISFCQKSCIAKAEEYHKPQPKNVPAGFSAM